MSKLISIIALTGGFLFVAQGFHVWHFCDAHFSINWLTTAALFISGMLMLSLGIALYSQSNDEAAF